MFDIWFNEETAKKINKKRINIYLYVATFTLKSSLKAYFQLNFQFQVFWNRITSSTSTS